jgi:hypothetical protein
MLGTLSKIPNYASKVARVLDPQPPPNGENKRNGYQDSPYIPELQVPTVEIGKNIIAKMESVFML